jgi:hypothetical protein
MRRKMNVRKLSLLGVVVGASALGGCTGSYVYADHGWANTSWIWYDGGHHDGYGSIRHGYGRHDSGYAGGHRGSRNGYGGGHRGGRGGGHGGGRSGGHSSGH